MKRALTFFAALLATSLACAQNPPYQVHIGRTLDPIVLDGLLDEETWQKADKIAGFQQQFPADTGLALSQTEVRFAFDQEFLYVAITCADPAEGKYVVQSLRRDYNFGRNDNITLYLDSFGDKTNGFAFGITPYGVVREGLVSNGADVSTDWDNKWYSKTSTGNGVWMAEMKIPFKTIRYKSEIPVWNVKVLRNDLKQNERSVWPPTPLQFRPSSMAYSGELIWDAPPPKVGANISLIPYVSGRVDKNFEENTDSEIDFNAGFDAKVAVSSALNLDLTVNPDFSQVEVDRQVTNLDRFELFFPERRQFFLENADLFAFFGFPRNRVFFSRRIGLNAPILAGARLSGKLDENWRLGLLNMQTRVSEDADGNIVPARNFSVATFQRKLFSNSNIQGIFTNKEATNWGAENPGLDGVNKFNRAFGLEYNLLTPDNKWEGDFYYFRTVTPETRGGQYAQGAFFGRRFRNGFIGWSHEFIGENYNPEIGFAPRTGFKRFNPFVDFSFYPKKGIVQRHGPELRSTWFTDTDWNLTDRFVNAEYNASLFNTSFISLSYNHSYILLQDDFNPTNNDDEMAPVLLAGTDYTFQTLEFNYDSDRRKLLTYGFNLGYGGFFNADRRRVRGYLNYRIQPFVVLGIDADYNRLLFPEPFTDESFLLVSSRVEVTFTDKLFLTTFVQYNEQANNLNINSRLQWRFKPVSDLFVVYTDNYFADSFGARTRALIFKLSYWLNV